MHFYDWNIGDYAKKTQHLTNEEDLAYRRALDMYYDTEKPMPYPLESGGLATLSRRLRVDPQALKNVLDEFFPGGRNQHADEKIAAYYAFIEKQKNNGKQGGRPKTKPTANPPLSQKNPTPSQPLPTEPLPTNQDRVGVDASAYALMAVELRKHGVPVTPAHPLLVRWVDDSYTIKQVLDALEVARISKPPPANMPAKYLDTVLRNPATPSGPTQKRRPQNDRAATFAGLTGKSSPQCREGGGRTLDAE